MANLTRVQSTSSTEINYSIEIQLEQMITKHFVTTLIKFTHFLFIFHWLFTLITSILQVKKKTVNWIKAPTAKFLCMKYFLFLAFIFSSFMRMGKIYTLMHLFGFFLLSGREKFHLFFDTLHYNFVWSSQITLMLDEFGDVLEQNNK